MSQTSILFTTCVTSLGTVLLQLSTVHDRNIQLSKLYEMVWINKHL